MKKLLLAFLFIVLFSSITLADAPFHIGLMTTTLTSSEETVRGAEYLMKKYGKVADGGMITHLTFPDRFGAEMETTISLLVSFADDPLMKAIIVIPAMEGTVESFRRIRELRPDILLFTGVAMEDPRMVSDVADLSVIQDNISRGYLIPLAAKKMGADTLVHVSFPRHMSYELMSRRRDIMALACKDLGLKFVDLGAPDPKSEVGVSGTQQYMLEKIPTWIEEYGKNTAFFTTQDAIEEPIIKRVAELGGIYIEADCPSPTLGYPGALGIEFREAERGNWPKILKKVEEKVVELGASGRMGTWAFGSYYSFICGLLEHAKGVIDGKSELLNKSDIMDALGIHTPGSKWNGIYYIDADGVERKNFMLLYSDTYVFGRGYLNQTSEIIPEKYYDKNIGKK